MFIIPLSNILTPVTEREKPKSLNYHVQNKLNI